MGRSWFVPTTALSCATRRPVGNTCERLPNPRAPDDTMKHADRSSLAEPRVSTSFLAWPLADVATSSSSTRRSRWGGVEGDEQGARGAVEDAVGRQ